MKPTHLLIVPALAILMGFTGCDNGTARNDYPDRSQETKAEADAIRSEGDRREQLIDRDLQQTKTSLAFAKQQNADKARLERERIKLERDQKIQPQEAKKAELEAKAKRECERIDKDAEAKATNAGTEEAAKIRAEAASRAAEVKNENAKEVAEIDADIRAAKQAADMRLANVDEGEAKEQAAIDAKRIEAENKARDERLKVATQTNEKLDRLAKDSADRRERQGSRAATDDRITSAVRQNIARHGERAQDVKIATDNGVVVLSGAVPNETTRREIVKDTEKVSGVVRVEDRIAVH